MAKRYSLTEQKILKKLGIPDFRYMTKDKIVRFVTMMPHMDPAVAKAAISKFPEFKDMALEMTQVLKEMVDKAFKSNSESQHYFYNACNKVLETLSVELNDESIDQTERDRIENNMLQVVYLMGMKDSENKKFIADVMKTAAQGIGYLVIGAVTVLGATVALPSLLSPSDSEDDSDDGSDYSV